jgi:hypothetical protein
MGSDPHVNRLHRLQRILILYMCMGVLLWTVLLPIDKKFQG